MQARRLPLQPPFASPREESLAGRRRGHTAFVDTGVGHTAGRAVPEGHIAEPADRAAQGLAEIAVAEPDRARQAGVRGSWWREPAADAVAEAAATAAATARFAPWPGRQRCSAPVPFAPACKAHRDSEQAFDSATPLHPDPFLQALSGLPAR